MSAYRDELDAAAVRTRALEAKLEEKEAAIAAHEGTIADRDAEIANLKRGLLANHRPKPGLGPVSIVIGVGLLMVISILGGMLWYQGHRTAQEVAIAHAERDTAESKAAHHRKEVEALVDAERRRTGESGGRGLKSAPKEGEFDRLAAKRALAAAGTEAKECHRAGPPSGRGRAILVFAPSGRVEEATINPPHAGTPSGKCVADAFLKVTVPPFEGSPVRYAVSFVVD